MQIDDAVWRLSTILRKARSIKNHFAPINKIPPETLALAATFLPTERDLIDATAVCQYWRATLLYFPRLWHNPGGFTSELEAYLERSKPIPIKVDLSSPRLAASIIPHTSRLAALTVHVMDSSGFEEITKHLHDPIPTLRSLEICIRDPLHLLELPPGLDEGLFRHLYALSSNTVLSFHGPQTFPHITQLFLSVTVRPNRAAIILLNALEVLSGLVKVSIIFREHWYTEINFPRTVTLPCVQEIDLSAFGTADGDEEAIPPILQYLKLPKATSVTLRSRFPPVANLSILPLISFHEQLPNYVVLSELRIDTFPDSATFIFRSSSQAVLTYHSGDGLWDYKQERRLWGGLPLSSIRKVTAVLEGSISGREDAWLVRMLGDLGPLEVLDLGGYCGSVLQRLHRRLVRGAMRVDIKALIVHGGEYARDKTLKLESAKDSLGLENMTVFYILDPKVRDNVLKYDTSDGEVSDDDSFG